MKHENEVKAINQIIERIFEDLYEMFRLLELEEVDESGELKKLVLVKQKIISITNNILLLYSEHVRIKYVDAIEWRIMNKNALQEQDDHGDVIQLINKI